jgi:hypothetical protein
MADWGQKFDDAWLYLRKKAGACAANTDLEELKAAALVGQQRIDQALMVGSFAQGQSGVFEKLSKANEGLGKVGESLEKVQDVCTDITAVGKIHDAIVALNDDRIIFDDPQKAADSFDMLFQGFGRLCSYLPPPAKQWATFFESFTLFGNLQKNAIGPYRQAQEAALRAE